jgi:hypothetical protein
MTGEGSEKVGFVQKILAVSFKHPIYFMANDKAVCDSSIR